MSTVLIYFHKPRIPEAANSFESDPATQTDVESLAPKSCHVPDQSIFSCTANTLRSLGLTGKYDGFLYICHAVEAILRNEEAPHFQNIYMDVGKEHNVNKSSVERSIRYAIAFLRKSGNRSRLATFFRGGADNERSYSNSRFLTLLAADVFQKLASLEVEDSLRDVLSQTEKA